MAAALVLCLFALVLAAGEARAAEQPSQKPQQDTVKSKAIANGKVSEPVPGTTTPPIVPSPVEKPPAEGPAPEAPAPPPPPTNEILPAKEPSPLPIDPAPSTPEPEVAAPQLAPRPIQQWFVVTNDGEEVVESAPVIATSRSVNDFGQVLEPEPMPNASPDDASAPALAAPAAAAADGQASGPSPDPVLTVPDTAAASEQVLPAASGGFAGLVRGLVAEPAAPRGDVGPLPTPANATSIAGLTPSAPVPIAPASVGGVLRLSSSLGNTAVGAVGTVQSAAASVASATAQVLGSLAGVSPSTSSTNATNGTQEGPSEGTLQQQPASPLAPPAGSGGSFSPFTGGGQLLGGGGFAPVLVGILALLATSLLRRDFRTYLISCEMPKPSSALLMPLERPG
jgi:hypothetical protein